MWRFVGDFWRVKPSETVSFSIFLFLFLAKFRQFGKKQKKNAYKWCVRATLLPACPRTASLSIFLSRKLENCPPCPTSLKLRVPYLGTRQQTVE
jgi:hypothetical protein